MTNNDKYVSGHYVKTATRRGISWENAVELYSFDPPPGSHTYTTSIYVYNGNTYIVGYYKPSAFSSSAVVWDDDVASLLPSTDPSKSYASCVHVDTNGDVYISGGDHNGSNDVVSIWKNGAKHVDLEVIGYDAFATGLYVSNGHIYVSGYYDDGSSNYIATVWIDGVRTDLTNSGTDAVTTGITVKNNKVYVSGYYNDGINQIASIWIDGVKTDLTDSIISTDAIASSIYVDIN